MKQIEQDVTVLGGYVALAIDGQNDDYVTAFYLADCLSITCSHALLHRVRKKRCHFIFACNSAKC